MEGQLKGHRDHGADCLGARWGTPSRPFDRVAVAEGWQ
jgi:hypothetical protein